MTVVRQRPLHTHATIPLTRRLGGFAVAAALVVLIIAVMTMVMKPQAVHAASFSVTRSDDPVPDGCQPGDCSLREALIAANTTPGFDTIHLPAGVYSPARGTLPITEDVLVVGEGLAATIIDGGGRSSRVFFVGTFLRDPVTAGLASLTIQNSGGGAVLVNYGARLVLVQVSVTANVADVGGGIHNRGTVDVDQSTISYNIAVDAGNGGGGIFNDSEGTARIHRSTINNNWAWHGGGLLNFGHSTMVNTTLSGNWANLSGGGIDNVGGTADLTNLTITENVASLTSAINDPGKFQSGGGGISNSAINFTPTGKVFFRNTILAGNRDEYRPDLGDWPDCRGPLNSQRFINPLPPDDEGHNVIGHAGDCEIIDFSGTNLINVDPVLVPLADNGGSALVPTWTHLPFLGSPAIDSANPSFCPVNDQRDAARPQDGNGDAVAVCDIGAIEVGPLVIDKKQCGFGSTEGSAKWTCRALYPNAEIECVQEGGVVRCYKVED